MSRTNKVPFLFRFSTLYSWFVAITILTIGCNSVNKTASNSKKVFSKRQYSRGYHFRGFYKADRRIQPAENVHDNLNFNRREGSNTSNRFAKINTEPTINSSVLNSARIVTVESQHTTFFVRADNGFKTIQAGKETFPQEFAADSAAKEVRESEELTKLKKKAQRRGNIGLFSVVLASISVSTHILLTSLALPTFSALFLWIGIPLAVLGAILLLSGLMLRRKYKSKLAEEQSLWKIHSEKIWLVPLLTGFSIGAGAFGTAISVFSILAIMELEGLGLLFLPLYVAFVAVGIGLGALAVAALISLCAIIFQKPKKEKE